MVVDYIDKLGILNFFSLSIQMLKSDLLSVPYQIVNWDPAFGKIQ